MSDATGLRTHKKRTRSHHSSMKGLKDKGKKPAAIVSKHLKLWIVTGIISLLTSIAVITGLLFGIPWVFNTFQDSILWLVNFLKALIFSAIKANKDEL